MRILSALALAAAATLSACVCGSYTGAGDVVYRRGTESIVLCENSGFSAMLSSGALEGRFTQDYQTNTVTGARGETGTTAFTLTEFSDGTASAPELGSLAWERTDLDQTELDHANVQCTDLESRGWWTAQ